MHHLISSPLSPSCARGGSSALRPSRSCPRHGGPPLCDPLRRCGRRVRHAHCLRVHASCPSGGALPKKRGNAGSDFELPYHGNTLLEVRWACVIAPSLTMSLSLPVLSRLSHHAHGRTSISSTSLVLSCSLHCEGVTHSLAMQFVQFVGPTECGLPCGHGPEMRRAWWLNFV